MTTENRRAARAVALMCERVKADAADALEVLAAIGVLGPYDEDADRWTIDDRPVGKRTDTPKVEP